MLPEASPHPRRQFLAKTVTWVWIAAIAVVFLGGIAHAIADEWRSHVSTLQPTSQNTATYEDHARTYFVPPSVARWEHRLAVTQGIGAIFAMALLPIVWFIRKNGAGRRAR